MWPAPNQETAFQVLPQDGLSILEFRIKRVILRHIRTSFCILTCECILSKRLLQELVNWIFVCVKYLHTICKSRVDTFFSVQTPKVDNEISTFIWHHPCCSGLVLRTAGVDFPEWSYKKLLTESAGYWAFFWLCSRRCSLSLAPFCSFIVAFYQNG